MGGCEMLGREAWLDTGVRRLLFAGGYSAMPPYHDSAMPGGVLRIWTAIAASSNGTLAFRCLNSWAWCGTEPYRSMLSQARPVPRAFGLPVVRIQSCLAVPPFWNQQGPGF